LWLLCGPALARFEAFTALMAALESLWQLRKLPSKSVEPCAARQGFALSYSVKGAGPFIGRRNRTNIKVVALVVIALAQDVIAS
jgi:hypothetical protein